MHPRRCFMDWKLSLEPRYRLCDSVPAIANYLENGRDAETENRDFGHVLARSVVSLSSNSFVMYTDMCPQRLHYIYTSPFHYPRAW